MISVDDALAIVAKAVGLLGAETISTHDALGRVLAAPVHTTTPLPIFDQSAVDGYALRYADIVGAPVTLPIGTTVAAATQTDVPSVAVGSAARIFTGGLVPTGADTIVRQELTTRDDNSVTINESVPVGTDIRRTGEELPTGAGVAREGATVTPGVLSALAFVGAAEVSVRIQPRVRVFVTGDEVVPLGTPLGLGEVPDANGPLVRAHLTQWGCAPVSVAHLADTREAVRDALDAAFETSDLVLTTGGVSVGDFDFIPSVAEELGAERLFWKVAQKPGMPLYVAQRDGCVLMGLPGNPGAVLVNLHVYVRYALDLMRGSDPQRHWRRAPAPVGAQQEPNKTFWLRAIADTDEVGQTQLRQLDGQASHMLANLADANALVRMTSRETDYGTDLVAWTPLSN